MTDYIYLNFSPYFYNTFFKLFTPDYVNFFIDIFFAALFCFFFFAIFYCLLVLNYYKYYINEYLLYSNLLDNLTNITLNVFKSSKLKNIEVKMTILKTIFYCFYFLEVTLKTVLFFLLFYLIWFKPIINFPSSTRFMFLAKIPNYSVRDDFIFSNFEQNLPKQDLVLNSFLTQNFNSVITKPTENFVKKIITLTDLNDDAIVKKPNGLKNYDDYLIFFRKYNLKNLPYIFKFKSTNYLSQPHHYRAHSEKFKPIIIVDKKILYSGRLNPFIYKRHKLTKSNYETGEFWFSRRPINNSYSRKVNKFNQFLNLEKIKLNPIFKFQYFSKKKKKYNKKKITAKKKKKKLSNFWKLSNNFLKKKANFDKISKQKERFDLKFSNRFKFFKFNLKKKSNSKYKVDFLQFSKFKEPTKLFFNKYKKNRFNKLVQPIETLEKIESIQNLVTKATLNNSLLFEKFNAIVSNDKYIANRGLKNLTQPQLKQILNKLLLELMVFDDINNALLVKYLQTCNDINLLKSKELIDVVGENMFSDYLQNYYNTAQYKSKTYNKTDAKRFLLSFIKLNNYLKQLNFITINNVDKLFYKHNNFFYNTKSQIYKQPVLNYLTRLLSENKDEIFDPFHNVKIKNRLMLFDLSKQNDYKNLSNKELLEKIKGKIFNNKIGWDKKSRLVAATKALEDIENLSDYFIDSIEDQKEFEEDEKNRNFIGNEPLYDDDDHLFPLHVFKTNYNEFSTFFSKKNYNIKTDNFFAKKKQLLRNFVIDKANLRIEKAALLNNVFANKFKYSDDSISTVAPEEEGLAEELAELVSQIPLTEEEEEEEKEVYDNREDNRLIRRDILANKFYETIYQDTYPQLYNNYLTYLNFDVFNNFYVTNYLVDKVNQANLKSIVNIVLNNDDEATKSDTVLNLQRFKPVSKINKYLYFLNLYNTKVNSLDYVNLFSTLLHDKYYYISEVEKYNPERIKQIFKEVFAENFLFEKYLTGDIDLIFELIERYDYNLKLLRTKFFNNFFIKPDYNFNKRQFSNNLNNSLDYFFLKYNNFSQFFKKLKTKKFKRFTRYRKKKRLNYFRKFLLYKHYISASERFIYTIKKKLVARPLIINVIDPTDLVPHKLYYEDFIFFNFYKYKIREVNKTYQRKLELLTKKYYRLNNLVYKIFDSSNQENFYYNFFKNYDFILANKKHNYVKKNLLKARSKILLLKQKEKFLLDFIAKVASYGQTANVVVSELKLKKVQLAIKKYNNFLKFYKLYSKINNLNNLNNYVPQTRLLKTFNNFLTLFDLKLNDTLQDRNNFKFKRRYNPFTLFNFKIRKKKKIKFIRFRKRSFIRRLSLFKNLIEKQFQFQKKNNITNKQNILFKYRLNLKKLRQEQRFKRKYFSTFLRIGNFNQLPKYNSTGWFILLNNLKDFRKFLMKPLIKLRKDVNRSNILFAKLDGIRAASDMYTMLNKTKSKKKLLRKNKKSLKQLEDMFKLFSSTNKEDEKARLAAQIGLKRYLTVDSLSHDLGALRYRNRSKLPFYRIRNRKRLKRQSKWFKRRRRIKRKLQKMFKASKFIKKKKKNKKT